MSYQHADLAAGRWQTLPLVEQLANVGSDVARFHRWQGKDPQLCEKAFVRALELLDLTIADPRWKGRRKESGTSRPLNLVSLDLVCFVCLVYLVCFGCLVMRFKKRRNHTNQRNQMNQQAVQEGT